MTEQIPQVDYRQNPSFAGDVEQGQIDRENPYPAPWHPVALPLPPDSVDNPTDGPPMIKGYVQEGLGLDLEISARDQWNEHARDVAGKGYTSW